MPLETGPALWVHTCLSEKPRDVTFVGVYVCVCVCVYIYIYIYIYIYTHVTLDPCDAVRDRPALWSTFLFEKPLDVTHPVVLAWRSHLSLHTCIHHA